MAATPSDKLTWFKTIGIILLWISYGLSSLVVGSTLTDLTIKLKMPYKDIALGIALRGAGILLGASIGGKLVDTFRHLMPTWMGVLQILASCMVVFIPWIQQIVLLSGVFIAIGVAYGILNVVTVGTVFQTWEEKSQRVLPLVFMGHVFGGIIAPLITNPFLAQTNLMSTVNSSNYGELDTFNETLSTSATHVAEAYFLIGTLCVILVVPLLLSEWYGYKLKQNYEDMNQPIVKSESCNEPSKPTMDSSPERSTLYFKLFVIIVVVIFTFNNLGVYYVMSVFIRTLSIDLHGLSRDEASNVNALYFCGSMFGCLVSSSLAFCLSTQTILIAFTSLMCLFGIVFYTLGIPFVAVFWFSAFMIGMPASGIQSLFMSYTNEKIRADGVILATSVWARGISDLVYVALAGFMYDLVGPWVVPLLTMVLFVVNTMVVILFVCVNLIRKTGKLV